VFAIVQCKGFQYRVAPEDMVRIPLTDAEPGSTLVLDRVLLYRDGEETRVGAPVLEGVRVEAEVLRHARGPKIIVGKFKRRKGYRKRNGHRQDFTEIRIRSIQA
jgi:large subunit ribosomal protein L21